MEKLKVIVTGSGDYSIKIFNYPELLELKELKGHTNAIYKLV